MPNTKSLATDGLTKEFYETFWGEIKIPLCDSIMKSYQNKELSKSQKQAVIKLRKKRIRTRNHSHKKQKDGLKTRTVLLIFSIELEISGVVVQRMH